MSELDPTKFVVVTYCAVCGKRHDVDANEETVNAPEACGLCAEAESENSRHPCGGRNE